jgi:sugar phosphate isomerase/epimerase
VTGPAGGPGPRLLCWGTVEGVGLLETAEAAAAAGFAEISITPAMGLDALAAGPAAVRSRLADLGVAVGLLDPLLGGLPGVPRPDDVAPRFRATFEHGEDACWRLVDAFAIPVLNVAHYMGAPTPVEVLVHHIGGVAERAADHGVALAVEFMPEGAIPDLATAAVIVRAIDRADVGVMLDTWHHHRTAGTVDAVRSLPPGTVRAVQLSDAQDDVWATGTDPPTRDRLLPGRGVIPLAELVAAVVETRPDAVIGIEVFDRSRAATPAVDRARAAAGSLDALLGPTSGASSGRSSGSDAGSGAGSDAGRP